MYEDFETNVNEFFCNMIYYNLYVFEKTNPEYKKLASKRCRTMEKLENMDNMEDDVEVLIDEEMMKEKLLYMQGYKDCLKILKLFED